MQANILERLRELGGITDDVDSNASLQEQLEAIRFSKVLFNSFWEGYGIDEFRDANRDQYESDPEAFVEALLDYLLANNEEPRGQCFWQYELFTPFTEGTEDHEDWKDIVQDFDLAEIRKVVGDGDLEFVQIMHSYGYPDQYFVCLNDPDPKNPVVFGTDHEVFFQEITNEGSLDEFLADFLSRKELKVTVLKFMEDND